MHLSRLFKTEIYSRCRFWNIVDRHIKIRQSNTHKRFFEIKKLRFFKMKQLFDANFHGEELY
jgi:hypothetical protein